MHSVLTMYFANGLFNHNNGQLNQVEILQIIPNRTNTVLNVFWNLEKEYLESKGIIPGINNYH
jgi:hypothetical protein